MEAAETSVLTRMGAAPHHLEHYRSRVGAAIDWLATVAGMGCVRPLVSAAIARSPGIASCARRY